MKFCRKRVVPKEHLTSLTNKGKHVPFSSCSTTTVHVYSYVNGTPIPRSNSWWSPDPPVFNRFVQLIISHHGPIWAKMSRDIFFTTFNLGVCEVFTPPLKNYRIFWFVFYQFRVDWKRKYRWSIIQVGWRNSRNTSSGRGRGFSWLWGNSNSYKRRRDRCGRDNSCFGPGVTETEVQPNGNITNTVKLVTTKKADHLCFVVLYNNYSVG